MVEKIIKKVLHDRHYWRRMEFSELSELYASRVMRIMALSMVSVFVAVFLYQSGYSLTFIGLFFAVVFGLRGAMSIPAAYLVALIGPKHATLASNLLYVPALLSLAALESQGTAALVSYALFQSFSVAAYTIAYHVDFSKVKHRAHAGKEIGYMVVLERIAMAVSPLLGGGIAFMFGPEATIVAAAALFAVAAGPLLLTAEQVRTRQHITFRRIPWRKIYRSLIAQGAIGWDFVAMGIVWSLFIALAVFGLNSDAVYAQVGAVASVAIVASLLTVRMYGMLIDRHRGGELLRFGAISSSVLHLVRPFLSTATGVVLMNVGSEASKSAYNMAFIKGMFDLADNLPGYRIVYMACIEIAVCAGAMLAMLTLSLLSWLFGDIASLQLFYVASSVVVLAIMAHGLSALRIVHR